MYWINLGTDQTPDYVDLAQISRVRWDTRMIAGERQEVAWLSPSGKSLDRSYEGEAVETLRTHLAYLEQRMSQLPADTMPWHPDYQPLNNHSYSPVRLQDAGIGDD